MSFSFGQQNTGKAPDKPLFGAVNNSTSGGATTSLFGTTNNTANAGASTGTPSSIFGGGASKPPAASQPGNMFGAAAGAATPTFGSFNKPAGDAAKPPMFGGAGGTSGASPAPSFAFNTTCRVLPQHSLRDLANKGLQHPHPLPHPP